MFSLEARLRYAYLEPGIIKKIHDAIAGAQKDERINQNGVGNARLVDARKALRYQSFMRHEKSLIFPRAQWYARAQALPGPQRRRNRVCKCALRPCARSCTRVPDVRARSFYRKYNWRFANPLTDPMWQVALPYYRRWACSLVIHSFMLSTA